MADLTPTSTEVEKAKYDAEGFVTSYQPHLTERQVTWLMHRMGTADDEEANDLAMIDQEQVDIWMIDPEFAQVRENCMSNKREAFRYLGTQLLPKTLRTIMALLDSESTKSQAMGVQLLLRTQGLLIDKKAVADRDSIQKLVEALRTPRPMTVVDGDFRTLPEDS